MNPFVKTYIEQLQSLLRELAWTLEEYDRRLQQAQADKEEKIRDYWVAVREIHVLQETLNRLPNLEEENHMLLEKSRLSTHHARNILHLTKLLIESMKQ